MSAAEGLQELNDLKAAGFSTDEIEAHRAEVSQQLLDAGFTSEEVGEHFGEKEPDMKPMKDYFKANLAAHNEKKAKPQNPALESLNPANPTDTLGKGMETTQPEVADSFWEAIEAGWDTSVSGLIAQKKLPDVVLPEDAPAYMRIASQLTSLAGDVPAMVAGAFGGGVAGGAAGTVALPVVGTVSGAAVGAGFGSFALPAAVRKILMDHYEKGDIQDPSDFLARASGALLEATKHGALGVATLGVGGKVAGALAKTGVSTSVKTTARLSSEVATMTVLGKAMEGELPKPMDFVDAAAVVGVAHGSIKLAGKMRNAYAKTGLKPEQLAELSNKEQTVKQELLADNYELPRAIEGMIEVPKNQPKITETPKAEVPKTEPTAQEKILSQVGEQGKPEGKGYGFDDFYKDYVDKFDPVNNAVKKATEGKEVTVAENGYALSRMANDAPAKVRHFIEHGVLRFGDLAKVGKSLKEIVDPFKKDLGGLKAYIISKRALELQKRGIESGFDAEAAKTVVKEGKGKYETASNELVEFNNGVLQYFKDSGMLSEKSFKDIQTANQSYVSFKRVFSSEEIAQGKGKKSNSLKEVKGSERQIQDPFVSLLDNMSLLVEKAEVNRAVDKVVSNLEKTGEVEKVKTPQRSIDVKAAEAQKMMDANGIKGDAESFTIFRPGNKELAPNEFEVFRNGKREVYKTKDVRLAESIKALNADPVASNIVTKLFQGITTVKKIGISLTPEFIAKNVFRDQLTAGVFSKHGYIPFREIVFAAGEIINKPEGYYNWLKSGGANGSFMEINTRYLEKQVFKLNEQTGFANKAWNVIRTPFDALAVMGALAENATRLAEFKRVSGGASSGPKVFEGGYASREITVDFARIGAKMSAMNSITAFMNVGMQGFDRSMRAIKNDPQGVAIRAGAFITTPSILLWWANHNYDKETGKFVAQDWYQEIPRWQKDMFWIFKTGDHIHRFQKPQELGILFGSLPERVLDAYLTENPSAAKDFEETMINMVTPSFVPDAISPALEQYMNKSIFTGGPLVPHQFEGILPEYQYTEYTSEPGKLLSKFVGVLPGLKETQFQSPMIIDNYISSWGGTLGRYALQLGEKALIESGAVPDPVKPAWTVADIPFVKAFVVRYPSASAQSIRDFYEKHTELTRVINTVKHLGKTGDMANLEKELNDPETRDRLIRLQGTKDALSNLSQFIRFIAKNPDITPDEKRQMIDQNYLIMIESAKTGNEILRELGPKFNGK